VVRCGTDNIVCISRWNGEADSIKCSGCSCHATFLSLSSYVSICCMSHVRRSRLYAAQSVSIGVLVVQVAPDSL
jgi:hypothetical protein